MTEPLKWLLGIIAAGVLAYLFTPVTEWLIGKGDEVLKREPVFRHTISTQIPNCQTGSIEKLLARPGEALPAQLVAGADRTLICDNRAIEGSKSDIPQILRDAYPGCFTISFGKTTVLSLISQNDAVCRALYRVQDSRLEPASYEQGTNICLGQIGRQTQFKAAAGGQQPRECSDSELRTNGFLP